jgi:uncharacterized coiled-coil DUF342 family protein
MKGKQAFLPFKEEGPDSMNIEEEIDQFQVLEEKVDKLIELVATLKNEKNSLIEKAQVQDEKIADLTGQLEKLKSSRDQARQRIVGLLEKIEQLEI